MWSLLWLLNHFANYHTTLMQTEHLSPAVNYKYLTVITIQCIYSLQHVNVATLGYYHISHELQTSDEFIERDTLIKPTD